MKKRDLLVILIVAIGIFMAGCATVKQNQNASQIKREDYKIAIILSEGGLNDKGFNDMAYEGLKRAQNDFDNITISYAVPESAEDRETLMRDYAQKDYNLIIGNGFIFEEPCRNIAQEFPNIDFAVVDCKVDLPNVASLVFNEEEGSFLVGAVAAKVSKTKKVGFVGGLNVPLIKKFYLGYEMGVMYIDPSIRLREEYIGGENPFGNKEKGEKIAFDMGTDGYDVIFHAAGKSGLGVIEGAKKAGVFAIGVDKNQDAVAPGYVLTSMLKKVDIVIYDTIKKYTNGTFENGTHIYGIANGGIGLTSFEYSKSIIDEELQDEIMDLKNKIVNNEIRVLR